MKRFREYHPEQPYLLPPSPLEWLPEDHLAYFVHAVVGELDLSPIVAAHAEERGRPPYEPRMMLAVWIYAYAVGIRSSRKVAKALVEDVAFRFLSGNQQVRYWALNRFRTRHKEALAGLFVKSVQLAERAGLVSLKHVAVDGSKIKAAASKHKAMSYARMQVEERKLLKEINDYLNDCDELDAGEDELYGESSGDELPEHLRSKAGRLKAIQAAMTELEEEAEEKAEAEQAERRQRAKAEGREYEPRKEPGEVDPKPAAQCNFTDPESRIMLKGKDVVQAYNAQIAVDAGSQVILAADLSNLAADAPHLPEIMKQVLMNAGRSPMEVSADAGYYSQENLKVIKGRGGEAFIPPGKVKHSEWREQVAPKGRAPDGLSDKELMRRKLATKRGKQKYTLRQVTVEPVFGQVKSARGLQQFLHIGLAANRCYWRFEAFAHNLLKVFRAQQALKRVSAGLNRA